MTEDKIKKLKTLYEDYSLMLENTKKLNKELKKILDDECDIRDDYENSDNFISDKNHIKLSNRCDNLDYTYEQSKKSINQLKRIKDELKRIIDNK